VSARPKPQTEAGSGLDERATELQLAGPRKIPFKADGQRELKKLIQSFGQPGFPNARGKLSRLNEPFWAQLLANEEIAVFEPDERQFYWYVRELGLFVPKSEDSIRKDLSDRINRAAREWGGRWFDLQQFRSAGALSGIITHLRGELEQKNFFTSNNQRVHLANCVLRFNPDGTFVTENFSPQMRSRNRSPIL
jgi:hypothetical protein